MLFVQKPPPTPPKGERKNASIKFFHILNFYNVRKCNFYAPLVEGVWGRLPYPISTIVIPAPPN